MSHLSLEALARIADGPVTDAEAAHLDGCPACREELERMREEITALGELPDPAPPPELWARIAADLDHPGRRSAWTTPFVRAAAAIALFALGTASGWALRGYPGPVSNPSPAVDQGEVSARAGVDPETRLRRAEDAYVRAVTGYLEARPGASSANAVPFERMAALQGIALTARAALEHAPEDPVIEGYYRTAVAQQRALMSNVAATVSDEDEPWF